MAQRVVRQFQVADFSGGLNYRDDGFEMAPNELPDMLNMRILPGGRVETRKSIRHLHTTDLVDGGAVLKNAKNIWSFFGNSVQQIVVQVGNDAAYSTGGNFTVINPDALATTGIMRAAAMHRVGTANSERLYVQRNAEQVPWKWDGAAATVLADASAGYNANLAAPAGGRMPLARYICTHAGFMFHAYTVEGGTTFKNRVRWSHPGEPEDYRSTDYLDVGADDGDYVTGIASMGGTLYVFKQRSVWMLTGYDSATWQLQRLFDTVGAVQQEAIAVTPSAIYFFDGSKGVFAFGPHRTTISTASSLVWLWEKLAVKLTDNSIPYQYVPNITMAWMDNRLWVAVPWEGSTQNMRVFVYDPVVGKNGAWYPYEYRNVQGNGLTTPLALGPMLEWRPPGAASKLLACSASSDGSGNGSYRVFQLDYNNTGVDYMDTVLGIDQSVSFTQWARTAWFSAGIPGVKKRWRRPTFIFDADHTAQIGLAVFADYSSLTATRSQQLSVTAASGAGTLWGGANWNAFFWGAGADGEEVLVRGTSFGNAYAVQLEFSGRLGDHWGLHGIDFRFIPQRIR